MIKLKKDRIRNEWIHKKHLMIASIGDKKKKNIV